MIHEMYFENPLLYIMTMKLYIQRIIQCLPRTVALNKRVIGLKLMTEISIPDHSILSMKVRILEKMHHHTNSPTLSTPFRTHREEHWITAFPYGCTMVLKVQVILQVHSVAM
jgi:hypothetical protein